MEIDHPWYRLLAPIGFDVLLNFVENARFPPLKTEWPLQESLRLAFLWYVPSYV